RTSIGPRARSSAPAESSSARANSARVNRTSSPPILTGTKSRFGTSCRRPWIRRRHERTSRSASGDDEPTNIVKRPREGVVMIATDASLKAAVEGHDGIFVVRGSDNCRDWNNIHYKVGLSGKNVGAKQLSMNVATIPPGGVALAHIHVGFEVMLYI